MSSVASVSLAVAGGAALFAASSTQAQVLDEVRSEIGWDDLAARIGIANVPTGAGIAVAQVEADESPNAWAPDVDDLALFAGKTFHVPTGSPTTSGHATTVAAYFYSLTTGVAQGIEDIWLYSAGGFLGPAWLRTTQSSANPPLDTPAGVKIVNHSWVGDLGDDAIDNDALRRLDFLSARDSLLMVNGTANGAGAISLDLIAHNFNGITVGTYNENHASNDTPASVDGPGRMKPEILAVNNATSFSTPQVAGVLAMLVEAKRADPELDSRPFGETPATLKAILFAGARELEGWSNEPATSGAETGSTTRPLDVVQGSGMVNVDRSHAILTAGETATRTSLESAETASIAGGWAAPRVSAGTSRWVRFTAEEVVDEVSIALSWPRDVTSSFGSWSVMDLNLRLWRVEKGAAVSLVGAPLGTFYESGNVESRSAVDNVELLRIKGLQPGEYAIEVGRLDSGTTRWGGLAWWSSASTAIEGDLDGDGRVSGSDVAILLGAWSTDDPIADIDGSGLVDGADLVIVLGNWT